MAAVIPQGHLAYGIQLPIQSQSTRYAEPWEPGCGVDELSSIAIACDESGFFYVAVCDHVAIPRPYDEAMRTSWWDTLTTLGYLAGITTSTRLLSHVYVLPYRHPLMTAKGFLTLDNVSRGRAILGVGAGHVDAEFDLLGVDFDDRGPALNEALDVVRAAFEDEYPDHAGERWSVKDAGLQPRPIQAIDERRQLRSAQPHRTVADRRPAERSLLQPFPEQHQAGPVPGDDFNAIATALFIMHPLIRCRGVGSAYHIDIVRRTAGASRSRAARLSARLRN